MKRGSLVEVVCDFEELRSTWGFNYPHKGDILTVSHTEPHHKWKGIMLLWFDESDIPVGICDKTTKGKLNFRELLTLSEELSVQEIIGITSADSLQNPPARTRSQSHGRPSGSVSYHTLDSMYHT